MFPKSCFYCIIIDGKEAPEWLYNRCTKVQFKEPEDAEANFTLYFDDHDLYIQDNNLFFESKMDEEGKTFIESRTVVSLYMGYVDDNEFMMDGLVEKITCDYPKDGECTMEVKVKNVSTSMNAESRFDKYIDMTYSDIAICVAQRYGLGYNVTPTIGYYSPTDKGDGVNQSGLSDYVFLNQLASKLNFKFYISNGILYFVDKYIDPDRLDIIDLQYRIGQCNLFSFKPQLSVTDMNKQFVMGNINIDNKIYVDGSNDYYANGRDGKTTYPIDNSTATQPSSGSTYTVVAGDYLIKIAQKVYNDGTRWKDIANANPQITNSDLIYPGQELTIP